MLTCEVPGLPARPAELLGIFHSAGHHLASAEEPLEAAPTLHQARLWATFVGYFGNR